MHLGVSQEPLYRISQVKGRRPEWTQNADTHYVRSQNACQHCRRATLYGNLQVKCRKPEWAQNTDTHFVRACAVEMRVNIAEEPLHKEIQVKCCRPEWAQNETSLRSRNACQHCRRATLHRNLQVTKMPQTKLTAHTLCEDAHSKCMSTLQKSHFTQKFAGKRRRPNSRPTLCARLRSRNACQHCRRAT